VKEFGEASPGTNLVDARCRRSGSCLDRLEGKGADRKPSHDEGHRDAIHRDASHGDAIHGEVSNGESNDRDEPIRHA
jgi:hypothetical protein